MPIRNGATFLPRSIENISKFLRPIDELIIVNDGSTDETDRILKESFWHEGNFKILNGPGLGLVSALNVGLRECTFDWVARMDVDDISAADRLQRQTELISDQVVAIFSDYSFFSKNFQNMGTVHSAIFPTPMSISLISGQRTAHSSVLLKKSALFQAGGYREEDFPVEDLSLWLRISRLGQIRSVPAPLLQYRIGSKSITAEKATEMFTVKRRLLSEIGLNLPDIDSFISDFDSIRESYRNFPDSTSRIILLYRDFHKLISLLNLKNTKTREIQKGAFFWLTKNPEAGGKLALLGLQKTFRDVYRKLN
jgi:glycosyltransferase involved in cell wall biosynthesis